jgi:hypothetical protein
VKTKLVYAVFGAMVWGWVFMIVARYVLDIHSVDELVGLTVGAAVVGGVSAYKGENRE